jgi:hypothetical protein
MVFSGQDFGPGYNNGCLWTAVRSSRQSAGQYYQVGSWLGLLLPSFQTGQKKGRRGLLHRACHFFHQNEDFPKARLAPGGRPQRREVPLAPRPTHPPRPVDLGSTTLTFVIFRSSAARTVNVAPWTWSFSPTGGM